MTRTNLTDEQRGILARLVADHPRAPREEIRARFLALAGREVSLSTLDRAKRPAPPRPAPSPAPSRRQVLSPDEARELLRVFEDHPRATLRQVANIFRSRTGIRPSASTVFLAKSDPVRFAARRPQLSRDERALLARIVADSAPDYCRAEIRREFVALSGRPITSGCVSGFVRKVMGLPKLPCGANSRGSESRSVPAAIAAARARKLAAAPVGRTPRVGRAGRVSAETESPR